MLISGTQITGYPRTHERARESSLCTTLFFVCAQRVEHDVFVSVASLLRAPGGAVRLDSGYDILPGEVLTIVVFLVLAFYRRFVYAKRTEVPSVSAP
jgi:hypothetical protein